MLSCIIIIIIQFRKNIQKLKCFILDFLVSSALMYIFPVFLFSTLNISHTKRSEQNTYSVYNQEPDVLNYHIWALPPQRKLKWSVLMKKCGHCVVVKFQHAQMFNLPKISLFGKTPSPIQLFRHTQTGLQTLRNAKAKAHTVKSVQPFLKKEFSNNVTVLYINQKISYLFS